MGGFIGGNDDANHQASLRLALLTVSFAQIFKATINNVRKFKLDSQPGTIEPGYLAASFQCFPNNGAVFVITS
jgi:hypothetical protein